MTVQAVKVTTFSVSDVKPGTELLPTEKIKPSVERLFGSCVEACHDYTAEVVVQPGYHALFAAADFAYQHHFPLVLSPDHLWLTIAQGFAQHVNQNAEELRPRLVSHEGKARIVVRRDDFVKGSPENPWAEVFPAFSEGIRRVIGDETHGLIVSDFSTTGPVERAASEIVLMDSMQSYFEYEFMTRCGIPAVTVEGTRLDWEKILARVQTLAQFGLGWWTSAVEPIIRHFIDAVEGKVDLGFWQSLYKQKHASGGPYLSGWLIKLLPYLNGGDWDDPGMVAARNPFVEREPKGSFGGLTHNRLPSSVSKVPFVWTYLDTEFDYEFLGGLVAVEQDQQTLAVRPKVGWAVRPAR